jgi:VanZ family protein
MKSHLVRATVFIVLGAALLAVAMLVKDPAVEKWTSFALGASFPFFIGGLISVVQYFRQPKSPIA